MMKIFALLFVGVCSFAHAEAVPDSFRALIRQDTIADCMARLRRSRTDTTLLYSSADSPGVGKPLEDWRGISSILVGPTFPSQKGTSLEAPPTAEAIYSALHGFLLAPAHPDINARYYPPLRWIRISFEDGLSAMLSFDEDLPLEVKIDIDDHTTRLYYFKKRDGH